MSNYFTANWVVFYNPGQLVRRQEKFFPTRQDAYKWLSDWDEHNPKGRSSLHQYNNIEHTILIHDGWSGSARWENLS